LPGKEPGRYLIDEVGIVLLSAAQDLVPWPSRAEGEGALVLGGVDFGRAGTTEELDADPEATVLAHATDRAPRGTDFGPLPGTAAEASEVKARLGALALEGLDATEARLRREAAGKRILHLATHGWVREDLMRGLHGKDDGKLSAFGLDRHLAAGHDPMLLSGLAMAGANTGDGAYGDDGILTALEASMLDLEACDLVVLSACETARGTAESGEGVLGLVAGFRIAGARRVIGSLWKVDDEATRLLMGRFYEGILRKERPLTPAESLREAALWLRKQQGAGGRSFDAPRYWAAFVGYGR
jgi:CHAT domain-containing protein